MEKNQDFQESNDLARDLGLKEALTIGIGTMVGAGIFVLPRYAIELAGPGAIASYLLAGIVCIITAASMAELATGMPKSGGAYFFISRSMGSFIGTISGVSVWFSLTFAVAFYLRGFGEYLALALPVNDMLLAILAGMLFTFINYIGAKETGKAQNIIVGILLVILSVYTIWGIFHIDSANLSPFFSKGYGQLLPVTAIIFVSFLGFAQIASVAEEIKKPEENLPKAIIGSVIIVILIYVLVLLVTTGILPYSELIATEMPIVETARVFSGVIGVLAITFAALLATASSANASIMASSRISFALGKDGILPRFLNEVHPKFLTPYRPIILTGILTVILILIADVEALSSSASVLMLLNYFLINLTVIIMRLASPAGYKTTFKAPGYPFLQIIGALSSLVVAFMAGSFAQLAALALMGFSVLWFIVWARNNSEIEAAISNLSWGEVFSREPAPSKAKEAMPVENDLEEELIMEEGYHVLTPVANPSTEHALLKITAEVLKSAETIAEATALNVIEIPSQVPLDLAKQKKGFLAKHKGVQKDILQVAADFGAKENVLINPRVIYSRDRFNAIYNLIKKESIDFLLLGWRGNFNKSKVSSSLVKKLIRLAPCPVAVLKDNGLEKIKNVLIPYRGSEHAHWGIELAQRLVSAHGEEGKVTVLRVLSPGADAEQEREEAWAEIKDVVTGEIEVEIRVVFASDVTGGILTEELNYDYDLIIMGASKEWRFKNMLFGSKPDIIAEKANTSILMVRRYDQQVEEIEKEIVEEEMNEIQNS